MLIYGVTFDSSTNYGSCFQAYALQTAIEKLRVNGEPCRYRLIPAKQFPLLRNAGEMSRKTLVKRLLIAPFWKLQRAQFRQFDRQHMHYADVSRYADLPALNETADAFVCGSDVSWNPDQNGGGTSYYFLDFAKKYKFSYAASFGKAEIPDAYLKKIGPKLDAFREISVRETSGAGIARRCTSTPVSVVLDPVPLLTREEWEALLPAARPGGKYIFVYETHFNQTIRDFVDALRKKTGLKVVFHTTGPKQTLKKGRLQVAKPEVWLRQLHDAAYVVTNSFHATAFSVLFQKRFFTVVHGDKAGGINVRMNDFLNAVGVKDRIFSAVPAEIDLGPADFSRVDEALAEMREASVAFLQRNLEAAAREVGVRS